MKEGQSKKLIPIGEAAKFLGVSVDTVRRWDERGILHPSRPNGKDRYFSLEELEEWRVEQGSFGDNTTANCRLMQITARDFGYILSVRPSVPDCIAFVGDDVYKIIPPYDIGIVESKDSVKENKNICVWEVK